MLEQLIEETIEAEGQRVLWWREVPIDDRHVGETAPAVGAGDPPGADRGLGPDRGSGRVRAQAVRDPPRDRARRRAGISPCPASRSRTMIYKGMLTAPQLPRYFTDLRDPRRGIAAGARPLALLHQHVPELGARPPLPDDRPQRRGQHAARQRQLDARARVAALLRAVRRGPAQGDPGRPRGRLGLGDLRQRARAARAERPLDPARGDDDGPRGLPDPQGPRPRRQGLLRLPLLPDRAVGRPGGGRVHRRARGRRGARPQRAASRPLDPGHRGLRGARLRDGRDDRRARARPAQGPPALRARYSWSTSRRARSSRTRRSSAASPAASRTASGTSARSCTSTTCPSASRARRGSSRCAPSSWPSATRRRTCG